MLVAFGLAASALTAVAHADKEKVHLTHAGQTDARAAIIKRADLGTATHWTGGSKKPTLSSTFPNCGYKPKQSDLVLIGAADSTWKAPGIELDSQANVLETPAMVRLDWRRTVIAPQVLPCVRAALEKQIPATAKLVWFRRISFPRLAPYARAYRALLDVKTTAGTAPVMIDTVLVGRSRTEITLTTTAPYAARSAITTAERRLAQLLVTRIRA